MHILILMKKITHISIRHTPFDTRIFHKECKTLVKNGFDVSFIVPNNYDEVVDDIKIIGLKKYGSKLLKLSINIFSIIFKAVKLNSDIYHIHDPELIPIGLILKLKGKKIIYDAHEDHPKDVFEKKWPAPLKVFASVYFLFLEKIAYLTFNYIIAATRHISTKFPNNKTILIRNLPLLNLIDESNTKNLEIKVPIVIYQGGIIELRGIKQIIQ